MALLRKKTRPSVEADVPDAQNISFSSGAENKYAQAVEAGHRVDPRVQKIFVLGVALVVLYVVGLIIPSDMLNSSLHHGGYHTGYSVSWFVEDLMANVNDMVSMFIGQDDPIDPFFNKMVRYAIIALTGAGLALCGAVYQGSFKNALVSPSTLGVNSGASLGMMIWIVFYVNDDASNVGWLLSKQSFSGSTWDYFVANYSLALMSFVGCIAVVGVVLLVMKLGGRGGRSAIMMIICGQVVGSVMGAFSNTVRYYYVATDTYGAKASLLTDLAIASFYRNYTMFDLVLILMPIIATFGVVMALRRKMTLLAFSSEEARTMGVDAGHMQVVVVGLCTLLTAILISFCGQIGFVGFLVPHLARRLVGPNFSYLLPATTVLGAVFVLAAYVLVEATLGPSYETMVGMFISIGGAAVFLVTALRGKGGARGQFQ